MAITPSQHRHTSATFREGLEMLDDSGDEKEINENHWHSECLPINLQLSSMPHYLLTFHAHDAILCADLFGESARYPRT